MLCGSRCMCFMTRGRLFPLKVCVVQSSADCTLRRATTCRKLTSLVDKVNAAKLKREFKSFKAFMKQLDDKAPPGEPFTFSRAP